jgi:GntR family transcriptional regulator
MDVHSDLVISAADSRPMYAQILAQIKQRVAIGDWPAGREIPSIRELAVALCVSVITVKRAYLELEREGIIVTQQGKGSFVASTHGLGPRLLEQDLQKHLDEVARLAEQLGLSQRQLVSRLRDARAAEEKE